MTSCHFKKKTKPKKTHKKRKDCLLPCHLCLEACVSNDRIYKQQDAHSSYCLRLHLLPSRQVKHRLPAVSHSLHKQRIGSPSNYFCCDFYEPPVRPKIWIRVAFIRAKGLTWYVGLMLDVFMGINSEMKIQIPQMQVENPPLMPLEVGLDC